MRVLVEFNIDGQSRVERLNEVEFIPRTGDIIAMAKVQNGSLEVQQVIHGFGPDNGEQMIRLISKYIPDKSVYETRGLLTL